MSDSAPLLSSNPSHACCKNSKYLFVFDFGTCYNPDFIQFFYQHILSKLKLVSLTRKESFAFTHFNETLKLGLAGRGRNLKIAFGRNQQNKLRSGRLLF